MENREVPYIVFESAQARSERQSKRLIIALVICVLLLFVSNAIWVYQWCQYDYTSTTETYTQDGEGTNIIGNSNEVSK